MLCIFLYNKHNKPCVFGCYKPNTQGVFANIKSVPHKGFGEGDRGIAGLNVIGEKNGGTVINALGGFYVQQT